MIHLRLSVPEDAFALNLRPEDQAEVDLSHPAGGHPAYLAEHLAGHDVSLTALDAAGRVVAVGGLTRGTIPNGPAYVSPWLLCSSLIGEHRATAWRRTRALVANLQAEADRGTMVCNHVSKDATAARAFLARLGFLIVPSVGPFDFFYLPGAAPCANPQP